MPIITPSFKLRSVAPRESSVFSLGKTNVTKTRGDINLDICSRVFSQVLFFGQL